MPVKAIPKISLARNGVGAFVAPCHRITVQYCNWGGSSTGIRQILSSGQLDHIASQKNHTFFEIVRKAGHPSLTFYYNNDATEVVNVANLDSENIVQKLEEYSQRSGNKLIKFNHKVMSNNDSVRGIWSPLHMPKGYRHKI
ncbi:54S ribosomal protein L51 mitochondrial [Spathaspora sp. JA1]|nr:54S ribosomal protein L51 mitochondrial [Spathaspora sp. JA1]